MREWKDSNLQIFAVETRCLIQFDDASINWWVWSGMIRQPSAYEAASLTNIEIQTQIWQEYQKSNLDHLFRREICFPLHHTPKIKNGNYFRINHYFILVPFQGRIQTMLYIPLAFRCPNKNVVAGVYPD